MKSRILSIAVVSVMILGASLFVKLPVRVIYNPTDSAPKGYYLIVNSVIKKDDYVLATLPQEAKILAAKRQYLPIDIPILKPVVAGYGEHICVKNHQIFINGMVVATLLERDSKGRILVPWAGCRPLLDELFLLSTYSPYSFDGRYFGPVTREMVIGKAVPLWTFEGNNRE